MPVRLLSFDLDGTLVDTGAEIAEAANLALESHGVARRPVSEITRLIGAGTRELMLGLLARVFLDEPSLAERVSVQAVLDSMDIHYAATAGSSAVPYAGCHTALSDLQQAGVLLTCTTNKEIRHARRVLERTGLDPFFALVVGGDTLPEKKPHASVLRHVAASMRMRVQDGAHLGDSAIDVQAARHAGMAAWAVPYGYNGGVAIELSHPDRIFQTLAEAAHHVLHGHAIGEQGQRDPQRVRTLGAG